MKKLTLILLILVMIVTLSACGSKCEHTYLSDCDEICNECGEVRKTIAEHNYYGDCDSRCHSCGKDREVTVNHSWRPATCTAYEACERCGAVKGGDLLEHNYIATGYDDHYHYQMCSVCDEPLEESKAKHELDDEYTCTCGVEFTVETQNGDGASVIIKLYNSNAELIKELRYDNKELIGCVEYYYDENGSMIKETYTDTAGNVTVTESD